MQNLDRLYIGKIDPLRNPDGTIPQRFPSALDLVFQCYRYIHPSGLPCCLRSSNLSEANLRNIRLSTTCLYSEDSTLPRSLLAESHKVSSKLFDFFLVAFFLAGMRLSSFWGVTTGFSTTGADWGDARVCRPNTPQKFPAKRTVWINPTCNPMCDHLKGAPSRRH